MHFEFNFFSSLLLIFFVHGLVYAILLFRKSAVQGAVADRWLGIFLLLCIFYIAPWMIGFGGWYDTQPYRDVLFYVPFQQLLFMGPVVFFYVRSLLDPAFRLQRKDLWHLLPGVLYLLFAVTMFVTDKLVLKRYYFLANQTDPDFDRWYQVAGFISMTAYFILSLRYLNVYRKWVVQLISYADQVLFRWVWDFLIAFLCMLCLRLSFEVIATIWPKTGNYAGSWWYFLMFSIIFYYIAISGYSNAIQSKLSFKVQHLLASRPSLLIGYSATSAADDVTEDAEFVELTDTGTDTDDQLRLQERKEQVLQLLVQERIYEDPELSLTDLARRLHSNPSVMSKVINRGFDMNFNDLVNSYRVEAVKRQLTAGKHQQHTLLSIAFDNGFNSKATFNRAFRKFTGLAPKDYIAQRS